MSLPGSIHDREYQKFTENSVGDTAIRTVTELTGTFFTDELVISEYNSVSAIAQATPTDIVTYTVPVGKTFYLLWVECSGENIAKYDLLIDGTPSATRRTNFGGDLSADFNFSSNLNKGPAYAAGVVLKVRVEHGRPYVGNFEARILGVLKG